MRNWKSLEGQRVFMEYRRADGRVTKREAKVIKANGVTEKLTVWCEKRDAMRTLKYSGIEKLVVLGATEFY